MLKKLLKGGQHPYAALGLMFGVYPALVVLMKVLGVADLTWSEILIAPLQMASAALMLVLFAAGLVMPVAVVQLLWRSRAPRSQTAVRNPEAKGADLQYAANSDDFILLVLAAQHPRCPPEIREKLSKHPNTSTATLGALVLDDCETVRSLAATHVNARLKDTHVVFPGATPEEIEELREDFHA